MNAGKSARTLTLAGPAAMSVSPDTALTNRAKIVLQTTAGVRNLIEIAE